MKNSPSRCEKHGRQGRRGHHGQKSQQKSNEYNNQTYQNTVGDREEAMERKGHGLATGKAR